MKLEKLLVELNNIAPLDLAEDWDNVGLLAGDPQQQIKSIMLTIDMTPKVFAEARRKKVDMILAYHPPIFEPLKKIVANQPPAPLLYEAIRSGLAIYSMHTALDSVRPGVNDALAEIVGITNPQVLVEPKTQPDKMCKLVVFVPTTDLEKVSAAIFAAGAGKFGTGPYSKCSFRTPGTGTFHCGTGSNPTIGKTGHFEQAEELRLETILPTNKLPEVIKALTAAHSYEEPAYDIYPLLSPPADTGLGRFGNLEKPVALKEMFARIRQRLNTKTLGIIGPRTGKIKRPAVCAGSCGTIFREVIRRGCDFYLTGELKHHHALELQNADITTVCVSHSISERHILKNIAQRLTKTAPGLRCLLSRDDRDPFTWIVE